MWGTPGWLPNCSHDVNTKEGFVCMRAYLLACTSQCIHIHFIFLTKLQSSMWARLCEWQFDALLMTIERKGARIARNVLWNLKKLKGKNWDKEKKTAAEGNNKDRFKFKNTKRIHSGILWDAVKSPGLICLGGQRRQFNFGAPAAVKLPSCSVNSWWHFCSFLARPTNQPVGYS